MSTEPDGAFTWPLAEVDPQRMKVMALLLADPNPIHFDATAANRLGIADVPINQGPSTMALIYNAFAQSHPRHRIRRLRVRLLGNVLAGQSVRVEAQPTAEPGRYAVEVFVNNTVAVMRGDVELAEALT
ncbi:MAG TPA: MaoC/PaaZ C-terminal domain-containing protein [Mycobacterium sp.]|jgi:acyl dehydratase